MSSESLIHPTALIDSGASLHESVKVGAYSIIGADVVIGENTEIASHVVISGPTEIGKENRIFQFSSIGEAPQDLKYNGEPTRLVIGDRNTLREYVTINRGTVNGLGETRIGNDNLIMAYCHIAHDCQIANHTIFSNGASLAGHVEVGDNACLGGFTLVHQFTRIGTRAFCGMGSAVNLDIPPYTLASGDRARSVGINKIGLKRNGFSAELLQALHQCFKLLVKSKTPREESLLKIQPLRDQFPEVEEFVSFICESERGIAR